MPDDYDVNARRRNFIEKVNRKFAFLCSEFGYVGPQHSVDEQQNGSVISEKLTYTNRSVDRQIVFYNAYHPVDYGFELQLFRPSVSSEYSQRELIYYVLKEQQDDEQSYLEAVVGLLNDDYCSIITGKTWITDD